MATMRQIFQKVKHLLVISYRQPEYHHSSDNAAVSQTTVMGHRDLMTYLHGTCSWNILLNKNMLLNISTIQSIDISVVQSAGSKGQIVIASIQSPTETLVI